MAMNTHRSQDATPETDRGDYTAPQLAHYGDLADMTQLIDIEIGSKPSRIITS